MCPHICILYTVQYAVEDTGILQGYNISALEFFRGLKNQDPQQGGFGY